MNVFEDESGLVLVVSDTPMFEDEMPLWNFWPKNYLVDPWSEPSAYLDLPDPHNVCLGARGLLLSTTGMVVEMHEILLGHNYELEDPLGSFAIEYEPSLVDEMQAHLGNQGMLAWRDLDTRSRRGLMVCLKKTGKTMRY